MRALEELLAPAGLPPIVHCAKPSLSPSLERIRSVTRAISQAPAAPWPRVGAGAGFPCGAGTSEVRSPMNELLLDYLPLVIFIGVALVISLVLLLVPFVVAYQAPDPEKLSAYECGFNAFDDARVEPLRFWLQFIRQAARNIVVQTPLMGISAGFERYRPRFCSVKTTS